MSLTYAKFKSLPPEKPKKIVKLPNDQEKFDQCKKDIKELTEQYNQINKKIHDTKTELKKAYYPHDFESWGRCEQCCKRCNHSEYYRTY